MCVLQAVQRMKARHERGEWIDMVMENEEGEKQCSGKMCVEVQNIFCCLMAQKWNLMRVRINDLWW